MTEIDLVPTIPVLNVADVPKAVACYRITFAEPSAG